MRVELPGHPDARAGDTAGAGRHIQAARWRGRLRYLQVLPVAVVLWALNAVDRFRAGAESAGMAHAAVVSRISEDLGGAVIRPMNDWLAPHAALAGVAAGYYIVLHGLVAGVVGLLLLARRPGAFGFHRNALIAMNVIGLVVFWFYPVAPPRMLAGYHDVAASAVPLFSSVIEGKAAGQFAALPSLHVAWAMWVAVVAGTLLRRPALRVVAWLYPAVTIADVLATANHFVLDIITAPGMLALAYLAAAALARARRGAGLRRLAQAPGRPGGGLEGTRRGSRGTAADPQIGASLGGRQCPAELLRSRAGRGCQFEDDLVAERPNRFRVKARSVVAAAADGSPARTRCSAARGR